MGARKVTWSLALGSHSFPKPPMAAPAPQVIAALGVLATCCSTWLYAHTREAYYSTHFAAVHRHDVDMERLHLLPAPEEGEEGGGEAAEEEGGGRRLFQ